MANTYTNLLVHVVFSTKNRLPLILPDIQTRLYQYIGGIIRGEKGTLIEIGGTSDHIHIASKFGTEISISAIIRSVKANSSKWFNEQILNQDKFSWQKGYGAFSVSESQLNHLIQYIRGQEEHHRNKTFQEEYVDFLKHHRVEFMDRYLWD